MCSFLVIKKNNIVFNLVSINYICILDFFNLIKFFECDEFLYGLIKVVNLKVFL